MIQLSPQTRILGELLAKLLDLRRQLQAAKLEASDAGTVEADIQEIERAIRLHGGGD
jgi:hypothetical protein